jgi:SAM-dependent methyltransferase
MGNDNHSTTLSITEVIASRAQKYLALLRCPITMSPLIRDGDTYTSTANPTLHYQVEAGILRLLRPEQRTTFDAQASKQVASYQAAGWQAPDSQTFRKLPQTPLAGWPVNYWQRRALATAEMWRILEAARIEEARLPVGPMGHAVDLTDGMGWLGYGLDVSGYITIIVGQDSSVYGLGAFEYSRYLRVQGSLAEPPLAVGQFDVVVFSFSLETLSDPAQAIRNAARLLKQRGHLIVLSDKAEGNHIDYLQEAITTLRQAGYPVQTQRVGAMGRKLTRIVKNAVGQVPDLPPLLVMRRDR